MTRAYTWQECGRIPATPAGVGFGSVAYAPDGTLAVRRAGLSFLSAADFSVVREISDVEGWVAFAPEGESFAEVTASGVRVRALSDGAVQRELPADDEPCPNQNVRFSFDGDRLLTYGDDGLCAFRIADGSSLLRLAEAVTSAGFSGDAIVVAEKQPTGAASLEFVVYDAAGAVSSPIATEPLDPPALALPLARISPDGATLAAVAWLETSWVAAVWSTADGSLLWESPVDAANVAPIFSVRGDFVLIGGTVFGTVDGSRVWETGWTRAVGSLPDQEANHTLALAPTGQQFAARFGQHTGVVGVSGGLPRHLASHTHNPSGEGTFLLRSLALTRDGRTLVSLGSEALRWDLAERFEDSVPSFVSGAPYLSRVQVDAEGRWATFAGDGRVLHSLTGPEGVIFPASLASIGELCIWLQFRFSHDSNWLLTTTNDHGLEVYRTADLPALAASSLPGPAFRLDNIDCQTLSFSANGERLEAPGGSFDATQLPTLTGSLTASSSMRGPFDDLVISADGSATVTSSSCEQVFDELGETNACRTTLDSTHFGGGELPSNAPFPSFSPEGHWLASGPTLVHLPSRDTLMLDPKTRVAIFTPSGDVISGERDGSLARYCLRQ